MTGFPIVNRDAVLLQNGIGFEQSRRFHVNNEFGVRLRHRQIAREQNADFIREDFRTRIVHDATPVAIAIEAEADIGVMRAYGIGHRVQHLHIFGIGIVFWERVVKLGIHRNDVCADSLQRVRRKNARCAVAACCHHPDCSG